MASVRERLPSVTKGSAADAFAPLFNPTTGAYMATAAANVAKTNEDIAKQRALNAADDRFRQMVVAPPGTYTPTQLMAAAAHNPALMSEVPKLNLLSVNTTPGVTPQQRDDAARGAGQAYSATEGGTRYVQEQDTRRAGIAAGPGYAMAAAHRYGSDRTYQAQHEKQVQDYRVIQETPESLYDPATNTTRWVQKGGLTTLPPGSEVPYSPEAYKGANTPTSFSTAPGAVPMLGRSADLTSAFMNPNPQTFYAPTPPDVQVKQITPMEARAPGETEPKYYPPQVVTQQPGVYSPPAKDNTANTTLPTPATLPAQASWEAEQALRGQFNVPAGLTGQGFKKGDQGKEGAVLPREIELKLPEMMTRVQELATRNNLNFDDAARQVMQEVYGTPGQGGFTINLPTFRSFWLASPTVQAGTPAPARPAPVTPENHPLISPVNKGAGPKPAGPAVPPVGGPATVLAPPAPAAPPYQPAGTAPPPTVSLRGNPAPPAPVAPPAPAQTQPTHPPRPAVSDADIVAQAQAAIKAGADPAAVMARLRAWNIALPGQ